MTNEKWKQISGYNHYLISTHGRLKSLKRTVKRKNGDYVIPTRILNGSLNTDGYVVYNLCKDKKAKKMFAHVLVAKAFIDNPNKKPQVNHIDGNKTNNNIDNLEWVTHIENTRHAWKNGLVKPHAVSDEQKAKIRSLKLGTKHSNKTKNKMSFMRKGNKNHNCKSVVLLVNNKSMEFDYIGEALLYIGASRDAFNNAIKNGKNIIKGYRIKEFNGVQL